MIEVFVLLFTKHFILDFIFQTPYQYLNKGKYGHPGGLLHSGLQGSGTFLILGWQAALIDLVIHYHIDWAKVQVNSRFKLKPDNSEKFWWLLGLDQYLHYMTYALLVFWFYS